ncbi:hypothetical protein [Mycolicibacterium sp.]|uniref:hypothetical protein n=1 Tax=Mycolicibacterium TaxID=1866885 RepID=UPI00148F691A|nr:hypothetical protein [Mycolicibacterium fortuitum]
MSQTPPSPDRTADDLDSIGTPVADPFEAPSPPSRESAYLKKATDNLRASRDKRLTQLKKSSTRDAVSRATERLTNLAHPGRDHIVIRSSFIFRVAPRPAQDPELPEDITTRPPLTQVLNGKNQHAIALYLTQLFVRQMRAAHTASDSAAPPPEPRRRHAVYNAAGAPSEASLIALPSVNRRSQRKVYSRALAALHKSELVDLGDDGQRFVNYTLNREDGSGRAYTIPRGQPDVPKHLCLPTEFFTRGWHLILTAKELATFLAVCHYADRKLPRVPDRQRPRRIFLAEALRRDHLGLKDEAYETIHELDEFGLIDVYDPVEGRRRGRIRPAAGGRPPDPYLLTPTLLGGYPSHERAFDRTLFEKPAIDVVTDRLNLPIPRYAI